MNDEQKATPGPLELKRQELAALIKYGEELGSRLNSDDASAEERAEISAELKMVADKADAAKAEIKEHESQNALANKVARIGRQIFGDRKVEDDAPAAPDAVAALLGSEQFKAIVADKQGRTQSGWTVGLDFKSTDPTATNPDDLVQHLRPGMVEPFVYPQRIGSLFAQATMEGNSVSWLYVASSDGDAGYVGYGGDKTSNAAITLDEDSVKAAKIATTFIVPDEALDDMPALQGTLRQMLLVGPNGVGVKAEEQYISGSGAGSPLELKGVDALSPSDVSGEADAILNVLRAIADIEDETGQAVTAVAINPQDAFTLASVLNPSDDRLQYSPFGGGPSLPNIGVPWVKSRAVGQGTLYVGAWNASILYTRTATSIRATNQGLGLTDYNKTLFVAETRQALVHPYGADVYRTVTLGS